MKKEPGEVVEDLLILLDFYNFMLLDEIPKVCIEQLLCGYEYGDMSIEIVYEEEEKKPQGVENICLNCKYFVKCEREHSICNKPSNIPTELQYPAFSSCSDFVL